jgi:hypothetical protein
MRQCARVCSAFWLAAVSSGCMVPQMNTGTKATQPVVQALLTEQATSDAVEQKLGAPYARHFVSADGEVWTYLYEDLKSYAAETGTLLVEQAILTFRSRRLTDASVVEKRVQLSLFQQIPYK